MTESTASATERVGRYQLLEPIGSGPTGAVWRAKVFGVAGFERQFAVKRFLPEVTSTPAAAQALSAGARAYGSLEHPRIARMTEFGVAQGQTFTAVELVPGLDAMRLAAEVRAGGGTLSAGGVLGLVSQVARAIGYAHGRGISHLGLAPTNVIVTPDGDVKVCDFAILASTLPPRPVDVPRLAARIAYLAPEQLAAEATSAATDVFALGVLAYELVTGQRTFRGDTPQQVAQAIMGGPPAEPPLPKAIVRVLQRCLARSPFERFPDARAFADALDAALRVAPVPGSRKDIGAQVKATLERLTELRDNQLSGVLALPIGTGPVARLAPEELAPALDRESAPGDFDRPMTTMAGVAPPPIPAPPARPIPPAIPPFKRAGGTTDPSLGPPPSLGPAPALSAPRGTSPAIPYTGPRLFERAQPVSAPPLAVSPVPEAKARAASDFGDGPTLGEDVPALVDDEPAAEGPGLGEELAAMTSELAALEGLGDPTTSVGIGPSRQRTMIDVRTEPGVGIRPTTPHATQPPSRATPPPVPGPTELEPLFSDDLAIPLAGEELPAEAPPFARPSASSGLRGTESPIPTQPGMPPPVRLQTAPVGRPPTEEPAPEAARPRRWPWVVGALVTLGVLGGVGYFVLVTLKDDQVGVTAPARDAAVIATAPADAAAIAVAPADAASVVAAKPDATALATAPLDAPAVAVAAPDAAAPPPADAAAVASAPVDARAPADAAAVATTPADAAVVAAADAHTATPGTPGDGLVITSTPPGARLFIDGADQGLTPVKLAGSADRHTAVLLLPGHDLYVAELDGHGTFAVTLKDVTPSGGGAGIKVLKCAKDRYYVFVDGKPTGQLCPTERINCSVGPHTVEIYDAVSGARKKWDIVVPDERLSVRVRVE